MLFREIWPNVAFSALNFFRCRFCGWLVQKNVCYTSISRGEIEHGENCNFVIVTLQKRNFSIDGFCRLSRFGTWWPFFFFNFLAVLHTNWRSSILWHLNSIAAVTRATWWNVTNWNCCNRSNTNETYDKKKLSCCESIGSKMMWTNCCTNTYIHYEQYNIT